MRELRCPRCERPLQAPDEAAARSCKCPACHFVFTPGPTAAAPTPMPSAADGRFADTIFKPAEPNRDDRDLEVFAERARFRRELDEVSADAHESELQWQRLKALVKMGFLVGTAVSLPVGALLIFLFADPRSRWTERALLLVFLALVNGACGSVAALALFRRGTWRRALAVLILYLLLLTLFVFLSEKRDDRIIFVAQVMAIVATFILSFVLQLCYDFYCRTTRSR